MAKMHYVYRITNTQENKHYYGVRSSNVEPKLDLGIKYFSSSTDKDFIKEQKENKSIFKYKILKILYTRTEAVCLEIKLHNKFDVAKNESFYNRAKQTSTGFDPTGTKLSDERKKQISELGKGRIFSESSKQKMREKATGRKHSIASINKMKELKSNVSDETKAKISSSKKGQTHTEETKQKMSETRRGEKNAMFGKPKSEETKQKISNSLKNRKLSNDVKQKISETLKGVVKPTIICSYCTKEGAVANMKRWHFENCKYKD